MCNKAYVSHTHYPPSVSWATARASWEIPAPVNPKGSHLWTWHNPG